MYTFLNLPFLKMKYEALQKQVRYILGCCSSCVATCTSTHAGYLLAWQVEQAKEDLVMAEKELDIVFTQDYDSYLMQVESRRSTAPPVTPAIVVCVRCTVASDGPR